MSRMQTRAQVMSLIEFHDVQSSAAKRRDRQCERIDTPMIEMHRYNRRKWGKEGIKLTQNVNQETQGLHPCGREHDRRSGIIHSWGHHHDGNTNGCKE